MFKEHKLLHLSTIHKKKNQMGEVSLKIMTIFLVISHQSLVGEELKDTNWITKISKTKFDPGFKMVSGTNIINNFISNYHVDNT